MAYITVPAFPVFYKPVVFTVWFPLYPFFIWLADFLIRDARISALAVAHVSAGLATILFYRLAKTTTRRPATAAVLFCFFPPIWLLAGSMALVEPIYVLCFLASIFYYRAGKIRMSAACAAAAILAQKSGFLLLPIVLIDELWANGLGRIRRLTPFLFSPVPAILLQARLCAFYGDPRATLDVMRALNNGESFQLPFQAFLAGLLSREQWFHGDFWLRKIGLASCASFYLGVFAAAWRRRSTLDRGLIAWLGAVLLFNMSLGGSSGYFPFPRYMLVAAPAALLLLMELLPKGCVEWRGRWLALALFVPIAMAINVTEIAAQMELILRMWPRGYFQLLLGYFARS